MKQAKNIDEYIALYPKEVQAQLQIIRSLIKKIVPKAEESIKYGIPTFVLHGNLIHFAAYTTHIGVYPGASGIARFKKELAKYPLSKGTVQFQLAKALPVTLIKKIVQFRVQENISLAEAKAKKKGWHVVYHKDGSLLAKGKKVGNKLHGYFEWFRLDGTKMRSGYFEKDVQVGEWTTYDKHGKVIKITQMKKNVTKK
ncbi:MAG: DUF1801 domain-containing protein [Candidatus Magasanikbacteria bacterium]|nr:DUF1801 domain-containing protein [Candidatus Magasanikbacteria bacterium]